jgi:hypothetical protein
MSPTLVSMIIETYLKDSIGPVATVMHQQNLAVVRGSTYHASRV